MGFSSRIGLPAQRQTGQTILPVNPPPYVQQALRLPAPPGLAVPPGLTRWTEPGGFQAPPGLAVPPGLTRWTEPGGFQAPPGPPMGAPAPNPAFAQRMQQLMNAPRSAPQPLSPQQIQRANQSEQRGPSRARQRRTAYRLGLPAAPSTAQAGPRT
jgi:hypothetical protein